MRVKAGFSGISTHKLATENQILTHHPFTFIAGKGKVFSQRFYVFEKWLVPMTGSLFFEQDV